MTEPGANLPEETRSRIEERRREAVEAEIRSLEEMVARGLESRVAERRLRVEELTEGMQREKEEASVRELAELQAFAETTLKKLDEELLRRRGERLKEESAKRQARQEKEQQEAERKRLAEEEAKKRKAASEDPANRVRIIIRNAQAHIARGDMEIAAKVITEGLEIDGFNAELLDLDAKVREAMASDTFSTSSAPAAETKKGKDKQRGKAPKAPKQKAKPEKQEAAGAPARKKFPSWAFTTIAAVLIAGAALIAWLEYRPKPVERGMTLAVLPWNPSGDEGLRGLADALPELTVRALSAGPSAVGILGYATTAGMASPGSDPASSLVRLGYSHFLRGTISRRDTVFTVRAELTDSTGEALWSADFDRDTAGLYLVPREIAHGLRAYFREPAAAGTSMQVRNTGAFLLYLEGLNALRLAGGSGTDRAIPAFSGAVAADSLFADAWAGLAWSLVAKSAITDPGAGLVADAHTAAATSISLSPRSGEGYLAMGRVLVEQRNFVGALSALDTAAALLPADCRIPQVRGLILFRSGQLQQAGDVLRKAYTLDPRNPGLLELLATVHQVNHAFDRALWYRETAMHFLDDTLKYLAGPVSDVIIHDPALTLGNSRRVSSACLKLLESDPYEYVTLYSLARLLQVSGDVQESLTYLNGLETSLRAKIKDAPGDTRARMYLALTLTRLGRYADGTAIGEAAAAADTNNVEAKYLLARIYALQMYSPQTRTVDGTKQARATDLLKQAMLLRFDDEQICSADLYNVYNHGDIRSLIQ